VQKRTEGDRVAGVSYALLVFTARTTGNIWRQYRNMVIAVY